MKHTAEEDFLSPFPLRASKAIFDEGLATFGNDEYQLLLLSEGYALLSDPSRLQETELEAFLLTMIRNRKILLIDHAPLETAGWLEDFSRRCARAQIVEVENLRPYWPDPFAAETRDPDARRVIAVIPHSYCRRRAVQQRQQEYAVLAPGMEGLPRQNVHVIGIGPNREMLSPSSARSIEAARTLLTFDFVHEVIAHLELPEDLHLIPYDWTHYPVNIERIDTALSQLHLNGDSEVTLVVEGNPEVYDLLSCVSLAGRNIRFEVIAPAVVLCCRWVEERYGVGITSPSYVIVSGFNARHGVTTSQLAAEIDAYLCLNRTCLVIELFSGDLPIVLERVYAAERRKVVVAMMDMFTPNQQVVVFQDAELADSDCVDRIKSKFTSLAIVDESRLRGTPEPYAHMLSELAAPTL